MGVLLSKIKQKAADKKIEATFPEYELKQEEAI